MYGAREKDSPLAIDDNGLSVIGDTTLNQLRNQAQCKAKQRKHQLGNRASFHCFPKHTPLTCVYIYGDGDKNQMQEKKQ